MKRLYTNKFHEQKKTFAIHDQLDPEIANFIRALNNSDKIITFYSCQGMEKGSLYNNETNSHSSLPYFGFNVHEDIWDTLWTRVIPELMTHLDIRVSTNMYQQGIFIHGNSQGNRHLFWKHTIEIFTKYFIDGK